MWLAVFVFFFSFFKQDLPKKLHSLGRQFSQRQPNIEENTVLYRFSLLPKTNTCNILYKGISLFVFNTCSVYIPVFLATRLVFMPWPSPTCIGEMWIVSFESNMSAESTCVGAFTIAAYCYIKDYPQPQNIHYVAYVNAGRWDVEFSSKNMHVTMPSIRLAVVL